MNSALKPVVASAGVPQPGGQSSPAKGNVASVNHASVGHPQGAQNSLNHGTNNLAVQNLTQHVPVPQVPPHAVPSMAPVSANMAQMAQNMSNHGNLSHLNQNSAPPAPAPAVSPSKAPSTSSPLSLVAEKANASQPLALTRTPEKPEKKEPDTTGQSNGTVDSPKTATNAPVTLKAQNPEANKDKQDIAKISPSTTKPPEKPSSVPSAVPKPESATPASQPEVPKPASTAVSEAAEKSLTKPVESKPAPVADVAPTQSDSKMVPEVATNSQPASQPEKATASVKQDPPTESPNPGPIKAEEKKEEVPEKPPSTEKKVEPKEKPEPPKIEDQTDKPQKVEEKVEPKIADPKKEARPKSTLKLATVTPPLRKRRQTSPVKSGDGPTPAKKHAEGESTPSDARSKRNRTKVQLYQSPTPELAMATKLSACAGRSTPTKPNDDKLIVFYKNEYLAVRNAEGGFYVCQTMQNVYRTTRKIKIRWLSQDKTADPSGETYKPDFYDVTDMECVLTTLSLSRAVCGGGAQTLRAAEQARATSILQRALRAENSPCNLHLTPEHPDGLDLSLYTDESQIDKKSRKRAAATKPSPKKASPVAHTAKEEATPPKTARTTPKRSPKSSRKSVTPPSKAQNNNKRKPAGSTPVAASTSKTATAVLEKSKATARSPKRPPAPPAPAPTTPATPLRKGGRRAAAREVKSSPIAPVPSTSTGKASRTPRKPPARK